MQANGQNNGVIFEKLKIMVAENNSLTERLELANATVTARDREIDILLAMLSDANEMRSHLENKMKELEQLQQQVEEIRKLV